MREYVDADGVRWRRRNGVMEGKALERRTRPPEVIVRHHYLGTVSDVPAQARTRFWSTARKRMAESKFSNFYGVEFKDGEGRRLILIDESC